MIRLDRNPRKGLAASRKKALDALKVDEEELSELRRLAGLGQLTDKAFNKDVYRHQDVLDYLWKLQRRKCCYCERRGEKKFSWIEHFRPKTEAARGASSDTGYWWLAYELLNLYYCCPICNNLKGTHFPLEAGSASLVYPDTPWAKPAIEKPLLLDPGEDNPEEHITFDWLPNQKKIFPKALNGSERGRETTEKILARDDLQELLYLYYKQHLVPVIRRFKDARETGIASEIEQVLVDARQLARADREHALLARVSFRRAGMML